MKDFNLHQWLAAELLAVFSVFMGFMTFLPMIVGTVGGMLAVVWYAICIWDRLRENKAEAEAAKIIAAAQITAAALIAARRSDHVDSTT